MLRTKFKYENKQRAITKQERQIVARYDRLTPSCKAGACTKFKYEKQQRALTQKLSKQEL